MDVRAATTPRDAVSAAALIDEYRRWVEAALGVRAEDEAASLLPELTAPAEHYARTGGVLWLASAGGEDVGLVALRPDGAGDAEIKRLFVRPQARAGGAGRALVAAALELARAWGCSRAWLETSPLVMPAAHALYGRAGFREIPARDLPGMPDHVVGMELTLDTA